jgi:hypothetical protein
MRFIFDGCVGDVASYKLFKAANHNAINIRLVDADGTPVNMTGATATLEVYDSIDRKAAAVKSLALTVATAAAGHLTYTPIVADMSFGPGTYYAFVKHVVTTGSVVTITVNHIKLVIG